MDGYLEIVGYDQGVDYEECIVESVDDVEGMYCFYCFYEGVFEEVELIVGVLYQVLYDIGYLYCGDVENDIDG